MCFSYFLQQKSMGNSGKTLGPLNERIFQGRTYRSGPLGIKLGQLTSFSFKGCQLQFLFATSTAVFGVLELFLWFLWNMYIYIYMYTCITSYTLHYTLHITYCMLHTTYYILHITHHILHITYHIFHKAYDPWSIPYRDSPSKTWLKHLGLDWREDGQGLSLDPRAVKDIS